MVAHGHMQKKELEEKVLQEFVSTDCPFIFVPNVAWYINDFAVHLRAYLPSKNSVNFILLHITI